MFCSRRLAIEGQELKQDLNGVKNVIPARKPKSARVGCSSASAQRNRGAVALQTTRKFTLLSYYHHLYRTGTFPSAMLHERRCKATISASAENAFASPLYCASFPASAECPSQRRLRGNSIAQALSSFRFASRECLLFRLLELHFL